MNARITNGQNGGTFINGTTLNSAGSAKTWIAIQVLADAQLHTLTGNITGLANTTQASAAVVPTGTIFYGRFTEIRLHSGAIIAYAE